MALFAGRLWLLGLLWLPFRAGAEVHHALEVSVNPERNYIEVNDTVTVAGSDARRLEFSLHPALQPEITTAGARLTELSTRAGKRLTELNSTARDMTVLPRRYRVELPDGQGQFSLRYQGRIRHGLQQDGGDYARGFRETPGTITTEGVFLAGRSFWYPYVSDELMTFDLSLTLPPDWYGMSQGARASREPEPQSVRERWRCSKPQEEIYLVAGRFTEYTRAAGGVEAMVLLRQPDPVLARKYLDATVDYVELYAGLLGPYPYEKFALVENFWETGYGMPSFTLLGSKVIRFPFILHSSYPHEILHNWWGNGVYVDYDSGNWAEGLTSYLADHLIKEQRGLGVEYRRSTLQKYTDYVRQQQDFPLTQFRSRHGAVSEAVGYGKTLMLFHMLRGELGDERFTEGLRTLYDDNRFRVAGFREVENAFSMAAGKPLGDFFAQWVGRRGSPRLQVMQATARPLTGDGFLLKVVIGQTQPESSYTLQVPLAVRLEGREEAWQTRVRLDTKRATFELEMPERPLWLDVDPQFDVFRRLHRDEIPPAIGQALGAARSLVVLPSDASPELKAGYQTLARAWQAGFSGQIEIVADADLDQLPVDRSVWLFGRKNRFRSRMNPILEKFNYKDQGNTIQIDGTTLSDEEHAVVVMGRHSEDAEHAIGWLTAGRPAALPGLGRKLPHYGKYSYLAFSGEAPDNILKGQWSVVNSPLSVAVVQEDGVAVSNSGSAQLAPRPPLAAPGEAFSRIRMQRDIAMLADSSMEGRGLGSVALTRAADYIADQFQQAGLLPGAGDGDAWFQDWDAEIPDLGRKVSLRNVVAVLPGSDPARSGESLVIGAHYDHLGYGDYGTQAGNRGRLHAGADDNASGVAVLMELARVLAGNPQPRSIVFVAFSGEETGRLGSKYFIQNNTRYPAGRMIAMINLDTVGRLGREPLLALGSGSAEEWVHILHGAAYVTGVRVRPVADDIGSSDQTSFIESGVPAVQLFSGAHEDFHSPGDVVDRIDAAGLVKTAQVLKEMTLYLAGRPQSLTARMGAMQQHGASSSREGRRRVSLGIVPDYAVSGGGVRVAGVREDTPAAQAGLRQGDMITALNDKPVSSLRDYARILKELGPGEPVEILFTRNGSEQRAMSRTIER